MVEPFEAAFVDLDHLLLDGGWRIDLLNGFSVFVSAAGHDVLLHLEFEAAVVAHQPLALPLLIFGEHERRVALLAELALTVFSELLEHLVLREEIVIEGFSGTDALGRILLQQSLHQVQP